MNRIFRTLLILFLCVSTCGCSIAQEKVEEKAVRNVMNKFLDILGTPLPATQEEATKVIRNFASLFDFENLGGNVQNEELSRQYKQMPNKEARQAIRVIFGANVIQSFQQTRLKRAGDLKRDDFTVEKIIFSKDLSTASVRLRDKKLGLFLPTYKLHKSGNRWLIYALEVSK